MPLSLLLGGPKVCLAVQVKLLAFAPLMRSRTASLVMIDDQLCFLYFAAHVMSAGSNPWVSMARSAGVPAHRLQAAANSGGLQVLVSCLCSGPWLLSPPPSPACGRPDRGLDAAVMCC